MNFEKNDIVLIHNINDLNKLNLNGRVGVIEKLMENGDYLLYLKSTTPTRFNIPDEKIILNQINLKKLIKYKKNNDNIKIIIPSKTILPLKGPYKGVYGEYKDRAGENLILNILGKETTIPIYYVKFILNNTSIEFNEKEYYDQLTKNSNIYITTTDKLNEDDIYSENEDVIETDSENENENTRTILTRKRIRVDDETDDNVKIPLRKRKFGNSNKNYSNKILKLVDTSNSNKSQNNNDLNYNEIDNLKYKDDSDLNNTIEIFLQYKNTHNNKYLTDLKTNSSIFNNFIEDLNKHVFQDGNFLINPTETMYINHFTFLCDIIIHIQEILNSLNIEYDDGLLFRVGSEIHKYLYIQDVYLLQKDLLNSNNEIDKLKFNNSIENIIGTFVFIYNNQFGLKNSSLPLGIINDIDYFGNFLDRNKLITNAANITIDLLKILNFKQLSLKTYNDLAFRNLQPNRRRLSKMIQDKLVKNLKYNKRRKYVKLEKLANDPTARVKTVNKFNNISQANINFNELTDNLNNLYLDEDKEIILIEKNLMKLKFIEPRLEEELIKFFKNELISKSNYIKYIINKKLKINNKTMPTKEDILFVNKHDERQYYFVVENIKIIMNKYNINTDKDKIASDLQNLLNDLNVKINKETDKEKKDVYKKNKANLNLLIKSILFIYKEYNTFYNKNYDKTFLELLKHVKNNIKDEIINDFKQHLFYKYQNTQDTNAKTSLTFILNNLNKIKTEDDLIDVIKNIVIDISKKQNEKNINLYLLLKNYRDFIIKINNTVNKTYNNFINNTKPIQQREQNIDIQKYLQEYAENIPDDIEIVEFVKKKPIPRFFK